MNAPATKDTQTVVAQTLASIGDLATLPEVTVKIIDLVENANGTVRELDEVIRRDPTLAARVLRVINSAFYGLPGQVADVDRAIILLGRAAVKNIAIAVSLTKMFNGRRENESINGKALWRHSIAVAVAARRIATAVNSPIGGDEMFVAGLIHDIGIIVERQALPRELADVRRRCADGEGTFLQLEQEVIGATHQDFGQALTAAWRFPDRLRAGVGCHHNPEALVDDQRDVALVLRCADTLCCREHIGLDLTARDQEINTACLDAVGLTAERMTGIRDGLEREVNEAEGILGLSP